MSDPGKIFRQLHEQEGLFIMPNPWDRGSTRILAGLGFPALATTSGGMAYALGLRDGQVTPADVLRHCRDILAASPVPVTADLEKGFGDSPESVYETITAAAGTGLAGGSIEDFTGDPAAPIFDRSLAMERIQAACAARDSLSDDFVLTARCDNLLWGLPGLDAVIDRLSAYEAAGADVLYAPWLKTMEQIREVCAAVGKPVNVVIEGPGARFTVPELAEAGVKRVSVGSRLAQLAYGGLIAAAQEMRGQGRFTFAGQAEDYALIESFFPEEYPDKIGH